MAIYQRVRVESGAGRGGGGLLGFLLMAVLLPVFALGLLYVKLNSDQVRMSRRTSVLRREFGQGSKELTNLRVEVEMYSKGTRILSRARAMGLDLQPPRRGQVVRVRNGAPLQGPESPGERIVADR